MFVNKMRQKLYQFEDNSSFLMPALERMSNRMSLIRSVEGMSLAMDRFSGKDIRHAR